MTFDPYDLTRILFVMALAAAALMLTQRSLTSLFNIYAAQSFIIALIAVLIYLKDGVIALLLIAGLTVVTKVVVIPYVMHRIHRDLYSRRDLEFRYLSPVSSILISTALIFIVYEAFSRFLVDISRDRVFFLGAVIGVSLALIGMLIVFSRKQMITKIVGYLVMENGVLLFSLFIAELPFIIEILIILDLVILILLAAILAFGVDANIKEFHRKLDSFGLWPRK